MHAKADNSELLPKSWGQKIYSYPERANNPKQKTRVVIGGSHGKKTTITSMILHVMHTADIAVDYMVARTEWGLTLWCTSLEETLLFLKEMNICHHLLIADQNFICISLYCFDFRLLRCILMFSHP
jgi:hypothetical protein